MGRKKKNVHTVNLDDMGQVEQWVKLGQSILDTHKSKVAKDYKARQEKASLLEVGTILKYKTTGVEWEIVKVIEPVQEDFRVYNTINRISFNDSPAKPPRKLKLRSKKSGYHKTILKSGMLFHTYDMVYVPDAVQVLYGNRAIAHENGSESTVEG